jgi:hypothetical protein
MSVATKPPRTISRKPARAASRANPALPPGLLLSEVDAGLPFKVLIHDLNDTGKPAAKHTAADAAGWFDRARGFRSLRVKAGKFTKIKLKRAAPAVVLSPRESRMVSFVIPPEHRHLEPSLIKAFKLFSSVIWTDAPRVQQEKLHRMCQLLIEDIALPGTAITEATMRANAIRHLMEQGQWLKAADIAKLGRYSGSNPAAPASRWKKEGKVFAVDFKDQDLFAAYQFSDAMKPRPVIARVLAEFTNKRDPWKIAAWFASVNSWLGGKRPQDCLDDADAVIAAARQEIAGFDG